MEPDQLLVRGDRAFLSEVLVAAAGAPPTSVTASRLGAEALLALAAGEDDATVIDVLGARAEHEVRSRDAGGADIVSIAGLSGAEAVRCFAATAAGGDDATVELVAHDGFGRERVLLVRRGAQPPLLALDDATRHRLTLHRSLPSSDDAASVVALAEVLAHLPTGADIADAVQSALAEATVEVDVDGLEGAATALGEQLQRMSDMLVAQIDALAVGSSRHLQRVAGDMTKAVIEAEGRHSDRLSRSTAARARDVTAAVERVVAGNMGAASQRLHEHLVTTASRIDQLARRLDAIEAGNERVSRQVADLHRALLGGPRPT